MGGDVQSQHGLQGTCPPSVLDGMVCGYVIQTLTEIQLIISHRESKGGLVEEFLALVEACPFVDRRRRE